MKTLTVKFNNADEFKRWFLRQNMICDNIIFIQQHARLADVTLSFQLNGMLYHIELPKLPRCVQSYLCKNYDVYDGIISV